LCFEWGKKSWGIINSQGEEIGIVEAEVVTQSQIDCMISQLGRKCRVDGEYILQLGITDEAIQGDWLDI
jgi:hypothetical protein